MPGQTLLLLDAGVNLMLGVLLLWFPQGLVRALGLPIVGLFYRRILGAVLCGIGIALLLSGVHIAPPAVGLGLEGAVAINLSAALGIGWLLAKPAGKVQRRGRVILWLLVIALVVLSAVELGAR